jgi:choline dehydrogenase-like flavoprotein
MSDEVISKVWRFNLVNFAEKFGKFLDNSEAIHVYLNSTLTEINLNQGANRVSRLTVATSEKTVFTVRAKVIVLACGGLENARILLAQNKRTGTVFANDNIGRYFMEHPHYNECANLMLFARHANSKLYDPPPLAQRFGTNSVCAYFQIGSEMREQLGLPNTSFAVRRPVFPIKQYLRIYMTLQGLYKDADRMERLARINANVEQFPNSASRVSLADKTDRYGLPKIRLNWQLTPDEIKKAYQSVRIFGVKLGQNGLGRLQIEEWFAKGKLAGRVDYGFHHMGTTRMAGTAIDGVVDPNCRIFGLDNLFIAGSSVFPTSSCRNPTFTILALTIQLADHLKATIKNQ